MIESGSQVVGERECQKMGMSEHKNSGIEPGSPDEVGKRERKKSGIEPGSPDENKIVFDFLNRFLEPGRELNPGLQMKFERENERNWELNPGLQTKFERENGKNRELNPGLQMKTK